MARRAYEQVKMDLNVMDTFVMALLRTQECREAELVGRQAIQIQQRRGNPVPAEYYFHIGEALHCNGNDYDAERQLDLALRQIEQGSVAGDGEKLKAQINALTSSLYAITSQE